MLKINEFMGILNEYAPLELSYRLIEKGDYDNSGLLVKCGNDINKVLFSLDLSWKSLEKAIEYGCDTVVTHHPVIYNPIKKLDIDTSDGVIVEAIRNNMNLISMHLNLDVADKGIDYYLACGICKVNSCYAHCFTEQKILDPLGEKQGYGREITIDECEIISLVKSIEKEFNSKKILHYGSNKVKKIASFCGGGSSYAVEMVRNNKTDADTIVTSDMPHHILKELTDSGKNIIIIPHYVSEQYGFRKFYEYALEKCKGNSEIFYFLDNRFM